MGTKTFFFKKKEIMQSICLTQINLYRNQSSKSAKRDLNPRILPIPVSSQEVPKQLGSIADQHSWICSHCPQTAIPPYRSAFIYSPVPPTLILAYVPFRQPAQGISQLPDFEHCEPPCKHPPGAACERYFARRTPAYSGREQWCENPITETPSFAPSWRGRTSRWKTSPICPCGNDSLSSHDPELKFGRVELGAWSRRSRPRDRPGRLAQDAQDVFGDAELALGCWKSPDARMVLRISFLSRDGDRGQSIRLHPPDPLLVSACWPRVNLWWRRGRLRICTGEALAAETCGPTSVAQTTECVRLFEPLRITSRRREWDIRRSSRSTGGVPKTISKTYRERGRSFEEGGRWSRQGCRQGRQSGNGRNEWFGRFGIASIITKTPWR